MDPVELLKKSTRLIKRAGGSFAVAGGLAGNFFRSEPRLTKDVDFLWMTESFDDSEKCAVRLIRDLGFTAGLTKASDLQRLPGMNKKNSPVLMVIGRMPKHPSAGGVDILLPRMPWVPKAIERSQKHCVDYEFAKLPTITLEDWIIAKAFALRDNPSRYKDMDDLQSAFESQLPIDFVYLCGEFERHRLSLPKIMEKIAPKALRRASKVIRKHLLNCLS